MQEVDTLKKSNQTLQASSADHESKIDLLRDQLNVERETELKMLQESAQQTINAL
jgi:cell division protein FtsB